MKQLSVLVCFSLSVFLTSGNAVVSTCGFFTAPYIQHMGLKDGGHLKRLKDFCPFWVAVSCGTNRHVITWWL